MRKKTHPSYGLQADMDDFIPENEDESDGKNEPEVDEDGFQMVTRSRAKK
jgi:hypothetical protein